jgi:hypothetical protein
MKNWLFLLATLSFSTTSLAQEFAYGFKAGLNFNRFNSESETDDNGNQLETFDGNTGFHIGASFAWKATDLMGVRAELMYSQKGGRRRFEGPSYYIFKAPDDSRIFSTGTREQDFSIVNSYMDIPVAGYVKPLKWLEIYAGASIGFLVGSTGFGEIDYNGKTPTGAQIDEVSYEIDANFLRDNAQDASYAVPPATVKISGEDVPIPQSAGAYFEFDEDRGKLYKIIDTGLLAGLSIYFNKGLYVTGRLNYGMTDITRSKTDVSLVKLDADNNFISTNEKDRNFSIQASIGFSF